jgi:hypothetical protein
MDSPPLFLFGHPAVHHKKSYYLRWTSLSDRFFYPRMLNQHLYHPTQGISAPSWREKGGASWRFLASRTVLATRPPPALSPIRPNQASLIQNQLPGNGAIEERRGNLPRCFACAFSRQPIVYWEYLGTRLLNKLSKAAVIHFHILKMNPSAWTCSSADSYAGDFCPNNDRPEWSLVVW